jgi:tetratricopeptide (TPR) repeat protein
MDRPDEALDALLKAIQIAPPQNVERTKECELLLLGNHNQEAVNCYQNVIKTIPLDVVSQVNYGIGLMRLERWSEALSVLEGSAPEMQHDAKLLNAVGMVRYHIRQYKTAVEAFKQALEINPDQKDVRFNLGLAQLASRNKPGALSQYRLLEESDPALAQALYRIIYADKLVFANNK